VFDRPVSGRILFEAIIREDLDTGRTCHVQLFSGRRVTRRPDSRCRSRVITDGNLPPRLGRVIRSVDEKVASLWTSQSLAA